MKDVKPTARHLLILVLITTLLLPNITLAKADYLTTLLGDDPEKDANPASVDILKVYIANNGTHFRFIIECRATPAPSFIRSYTVWLDTKGRKEPDYCLVAGGVSGLYKASKKGKSIKLVYVAPIEVMIEGKSIYLTADLDDINYPKGVGNPVGIVATTQQPLTKVRDRAPDSGMYDVDHEVIPELPGITPFVFIPSVIGAIYLLDRYKFKKHKE